MFELTEDIHISDSEKLARSFHEIYERLAPDYGYETKPETQIFNPHSTNGRLMIAVCEEILDNINRLPELSFEPIDP